MCPLIGSTDLAEVNNLLKTRGLRLEWRAKCASGTMFHWVGVLESNGREIASCGGWYERQHDALGVAVDTLRSLNELTETVGASSYVGD